MTPIFRPDRFFAEREFDALRLLVVIALLVFIAPATVYGAGWVLTSNVDGTVLVDNPDRPPDWFCNDEGDSQLYDEDACEQPRRVERDVDTVIWPVVDRLVGPAMAGVLLVFGLIALLLHGGSWIAGGTGGVGASFAVTAWGLVPDFASSLLGLGLLTVAMDPVTVTTGTDPATAVEPAMAQIRSVRPILTAGAVVTTAWSGLIWRYGLEHKRGVGGAEAWLVAGLVAGLIALVAVV